MDSRSKPFGSGARLVWRRQRALWWVFLFNLALALIGTRTLVQDASGVLNHSLESSRRLVHGFDVSVFTELGALPEDPFRATNAPFFWTPILFTIFMLFMTGGILTTYYDDLKLDTASFFESCGRHFWRFLRLLIYFGIAMIPIGILASICGKVYNHIDDLSVSPYTAPASGVAAILVLLLLLLSVRFWFDIAQVIAIADYEKRMHKALRLSAKLVWRDFGSLFWLYLRISVVAWLVFAFGLYVWMMWLKPESTRLAFVVSQLLILWWLGTRLWQRASGIEWYKDHQELQAVAEARAPIPPPAPVEEEEEVVVGA